jgi:hypothetical protein
MPAATATHDSKHPQQPQITHHASVSHPRKITRPGAAAFTGRSRASPRHAVSQDFRILTSRRYWRKRGGVFGDKGFIGTGYITIPIRKSKCRELVQMSVIQNPM